MGGLLRRRGWVSWIWGVGGSPGLLREKRAGLNKGVVCWEKRVDFIIRGWSVGKKRVGFIIRGWSVGRRGWVL